MEPVDDGPELESTAEPAALSLWSCARHDLRGSTWRQRILLLATVGWVAYEWGFGNETVTPWILVRVISGTSGIASVLAVATVGFAFTTLQQLISGHIAVSGFSMFERTSAGAWRLLTTRLDDEPRGWRRLSIGTKALVVFTLGTTAVVLIQATVTGEVDPRKNRAVVNEAAALCGLMVGAIGGGVAAAVWVGRTVPALEPTTEWLLRVLGNPLFWVCLLVVVLTTTAVRRRMRPLGAAPTSRVP